MEQCRKLAQGAIEDGSALKCLKSMVETRAGMAVTWKIRVFS